MAQAWTPLPDMPKERHYHAMAVTPDGKNLVCAGGQDASFTNLKSVVMYNFRKKRWTSPPDMPVARSSLGMVSTPDGKNLVCTGGGDDSDTYLKSVVMFDFSTQAWTPPPDMPEERVRCQLHLLKVSGRV